MTIPASQLVNVTPGVLSTGGSGVTIPGLALTTNTRVPIGSVLSFPSLTAVGNYFGPASAEYTYAGYYFGGFDNSNIKPGALLFAQYATAAVAGYMRGASLASVTLTQLQSYTGTLTIDVDGAQETSGTINLSAATSFSNAATIILAGFTAPTFTVTFDSVSSAFVFTSNTTGATSSVSFATGTLAADLGLTSTAGGVVSPGSAAMTPATAMAAFAAANLTWVNFTHLFNPDVSGIANRLAFAAWTNAQGNRYGYVPWDPDTAPTLSNADTACLAYQIKIVEQYSGTVVTWGTDATYSMFYMGSAASIDFTQKNGRITLAYKSQSGIAPNVTSQTVYTNLLANGYNVYASFATASQTFNNYQPGSISGPWVWADSYINQIWLNASLQSAAFNFFQNVKSDPYNQAGYTLLRSALADPIAAALNFGAIQPGVTLSAAQIAQVNNAAGINIAGTLSQVGYYLQILDASPSVRAVRGSPPMTLWYMDGGSIQSINLSSITVQ